MRVVYLHECYICMHIQLCKYRSFLVGWSTENVPQGGFCLLNWRASNSHDCVFTDPLDTSSANNGRNWHSNWCTLLNCTTTCEAGGIGAIAGWVNVNCRAFDSSLDESYVIFNPVLEELNSIPIYCLIYIIKYFPINKVTPSPECLGNLKSS